MLSGTLIVSQRLSGRPHQDVEANGDMNRERQTNSDEHVRWLDLESDQLFA